MKRIGFFAAIGIFIFVSCKKEKVEPVTEIKKNDTIVTNPPYWCVKSAVLKNYGRKSRFQFEYNLNSQLASVEEHILDDTANVRNRITTYTYEGDKLVHIKWILYNDIQEEFRTYENGKISKTEVIGNTGYFDRQSPSVTSYQYLDNTISTITYQHKRLFRTDSVVTIFKNYADSSIAETKGINIFNDGVKAPYNFKSKLYKNDPAKILYKISSESIFLNYMFSTILSREKNRFNPLVWYYFDINIQHVIPQVAFLNLNFDNVFIGSIQSPTYASDKRFNYLYDYENRVIKITEGENESFQGEEPAFPYELILTY